MLEISLSIICFFLNELKLIYLHASIAIVSISGLNYCHQLFIILLNINYLFVHIEVVTLFNTYNSIKHQ